MQHIPFPKSSITGLSWMGLPDTSGMMMLAILGQMNESQWWLPALIREKQLEQFSALLEYARANVPYYQETLPERISGQSMEDYLLQVPILGRESIQNNFQALQSSALPASHGDTKLTSTSGSVGKPIKINQSSMFLVFEACGLLRQHRWHNRNFMGSLATIYHQTNLAEIYPGGPDFPNWGWPVDVVYPSGPASLFELKQPIAKHGHQLGCVTDDKNGQGAINIGFVATIGRV